MISHTGVITKLFPNLLDDDYLRLSSAIFLGYKPDDQRTLSSKNSYRYSLILSYFNKK